jgi:hypothetical protein
MRDSTTKMDSVNLERLRRALSEAKAARSLRLSDGHAELVAEMPNTAIVFGGAILVSVFGPRWPMPIIGWPRGDCARTFCHETIHAVA